MQEYKENQLYLDTKITTCSAVPSLPLYIVQSWREVKKKKKKPSRLGCPGPHSVAQGVLGLKA